MKTEDERKKLIEQIKKTPIVQIACERSGISRATYYRWRKASKKFREEADQALFEGVALINELAESQLISGIRDKNMTAIIYWLKHHHKDYKTRIEISGHIKTAEEVLTPEQRKIVERAIQMGCSNNNNNNLPKLT